jgi:hypothetical protein
MCIAKQTLEWNFRKMILEGEKKDWLKSLFLECSKQSIKRV